MNFDEINELTTDSVMIFLMARIIDMSLLPANEYLYTLNEDEQLSAYDRVTLNAAFTKPTQQELDNELVMYKQELIVLEQARLDELGRVAAIEDRFYAIPDIRAALSEAEVVVSNPLLELKRIIEEDDQVRLTLLEQKYTTFKSSDDIVRAKKTRRLNGKKARTICSDIFDVIAGYNIENALTDIQKDQMEVTYSAILQVLSVNRPMKAKSLIVAIVPDGVLVTQALKDEILEVYSKNGL